MEGDENTTDPTLSPMPTGVETESAVQTDTDKAMEVMTILDQWVRDFLHNSPVSRSTEAYAHIKSQLPVLAKMLANMV